MTQISQNIQDQSHQINLVNASVIEPGKSAKNNATLVMENSLLAGYLGEVANNMDKQSDNVVSYLNQLIDQEM